MVDPQPGSLHLRGSSRGNRGGSVVGVDHQHHQHRRLEDESTDDVDYWRSRAGWADDDESMKSYNQGVYNTYYMGDDGAGGSTSNNSQHNSTTCQHPAENHQAAATLTNQMGGSTRVWTEADRRAPR